MLAENSASGSQPILDQVVMELEHDSEARLGLLVQDDEERKCRGANYHLEHDGCQLGGQDVLCAEGKIFNGCEDNDDADVDRVSDGESN